jgi:hypothetical protein
VCRYLFCIIFASNNSLYSLNFNVYIYYFNHITNSNAHIFGSVKTSLSTKVALQDHIIENLGNL